MKPNKILREYSPLIIDGGLSNVLESYGFDLNHKLWTAKLIDENPDAIIQAHIDYLEAGAQCITTASYQASVPGLLAEGFNKREAMVLMQKSVELADIAINRFMQTNRIEEKPSIAASIGPYGAYLADGSEYCGDYGLSDEVLKQFHANRIELFNNSNADILACETIPSYQEAKVLADILVHVDKAAWISFSCKDEEHLNDGSKIIDCAAIFKNHPNVFAVGVNCTKPQYISGIIKNLKKSGCGKKIIAYPNSGEAYNAKSKTWLGISDPNLFVKMAKEWV